MNIPPFPCQSKSLRHFTKLHNKSKSGLISVDAVSMVSLKLRLHGLGLRQCFIPGRQHIYGEVTEGSLLRRHNTVKVLLESVSGIFFKWLQILTELEY